MFCVPADIILQHVNKEEIILDDQSFLNQFIKFSMKQEEDKQSQTQEEVEELRIIDLRLKEESGDSQATSVEEEGLKSRDQTSRLASWGIFRRVWS